MWFRYAAVLCLLSGDAVTASTLSVVACLCSSTHWYPLWPPTHTPPSPTRPTHLPVCQLFTVPSPQAHGRVQVWVLRLLGGSQASAQTTHAPAHCGLVKLWHSRGDLTSQVSLLRYVIFLAWLHVADCSAVLPAVTFVSLVKIAHVSRLKWDIKHNILLSACHSFYMTVRPHWSDSPAECHGIRGGTEWVDGY